MGAWRDVRSSSGIDSGGWSFITTIGAIQVVVILANLLRSKASAVLLGPEGVGIIGIVDQAVQVVLQLCTLSLPFAALKFLSRSHSRGFEAFQHSYASFLQVLLLLTLGGSALALGLASFRSDLLGFVGDYRLLFTVALIGLPGITLQAFLRNVFAATGRTRSAALFDVVVAVTIVVTVVPGMMAGGALGYYIAQTFAGVVIVATTLTYIRRRLGLRAVGVGSMLRREFRDNQGIATFALINYLVSFATPIAFLVARYAVLDDLGEASAGLLQAVYGLSLVLPLILVPVNGLYLMPILNRDIPTSEKLQAATEFMRKLMVITGAIAMPIVLFPEWLLYLLYSRDFLRAAPSIVFFVVGQTILLQAGVYQALMLGIDRPMAYGVIMLLGQLLMGSGAWLFVPVHGLEGVALGLILQGTWVVLASSAYVRWRHGLSVPLRIHCLVFCVLFALLFAGQLAAGYGGLDPVVIAGKVAGYVVFVLSLGFLFFGPSEIVELKRRSKALLARVAGHVGRLRNSRQT